MNAKTDQQRQAIADKLKRLRIEAGYTSYERFAVEKSLDRKQYWRIEENQANIRIESLLRVVEIHGLSLEEFFKGL